MPASSARWMMRIESSWSVLPQAPNIIVPRQSFETWTPVRPSGRYSIVLGLRDRHAEGFQRDRLGLRAAAAAGVQCVDLAELVAGQLEVEDVDVLGDAVRLGRLRDDRASVLDAPAEHHLGRGLAVRLGDLRDDGVPQRAGVLALAVEGDAADRRPRLGEDAALLAE